jgi:hypothetical protein
MYFRWIIQSGPKVGIKYIVYCVPTFWPTLYKWQTRCNNNNFIDLWIISTCFGQSFAHLQERKTVVYSNVVYCPNVVVGWRSGLRWRRLRVRCEGCCSSNIFTPNTQYMPPQSGPPTYYNIRTIHHIAVNHSLKLLKMDKWLPETCWADSKINKIVTVASIWSFMLLTYIDDARSKTNQGWW